MILSDHQLALLASGMGVVGQNPREMASQLKALFPTKIRYWVGGVRQLGVPVEPCTWNMALRRRYTLWGAVMLLGLFERLFVDPQRFSYRSINLKMQQAHPRLC